MKRISAFPVRMVALLSLSLGLTVPHEAVATIVITGGSLVLTQNDNILNLLGDSRGFSLRGGGEIGIRPQGPYGAGALIDLHAVWGGIDVGGSFTLDGTTYLMGSVLWPTDPDFRGLGQVDFEGSAIAPPFGAPTATITAPFTFSGVVQTSNAGHPLIIGREDLTGAGTVTLDLVMVTGPPVWVLEDAHYEFQTPEPNALFLLGSGLVGLGGIAWRRHRRS